MVLPCSIIADLGGRQTQTDISQSVRNSSLAGAVQ